MVTIASAEEFGTTESAPADIDSTMVSHVTESLDAEIMTLDMYEGATSGQLFDSTGLSVTHIETPTESLTELFRIEPDPGETVSDAVDTLSFAGD
jgi:hypothetical protein